MKNVRIMYLRPRNKMNVDVEMRTREFILKFNRVRTSHAYQPFYTFEKKKVAKFSLEIVLNKARVHISMCSEF